MAGPEGSGGFGLPPRGPGGPEGNVGAPREFREYFERSGVFPISGQDLVEDLQTTEIGEGGDTTELEEVIERTLSFKEGLGGYVSGEVFRLEPSRIDDQTNRQKIFQLEQRFTTVESAIERPYAGYIDTALEEAVDGRIRRSQAWRNNPEAWLKKTNRRLDRLDQALKQRGMPGLTEEERNKRVKEEEKTVSNEYLAIPKLIELKNHIHSRGLFDTAFIHRMRSCEDPGVAAKLGSSDFPTVTPDGPHWSGLFRGEKNTDFGQRVNLIMEEMIKFALPDKTITDLGLTPIPSEVRNQVPSSVYAKGFENATMFATWLDHLLKKADGRMDVVWNGWKLMLTLEVADKLGEAINDKGKFILATPPIGNSLMTYTSHLEKKRALEFGLNAAGKRMQFEKFVSHSGLPLSLGKFPNPCEDYLHQTTIEFDRTYLRQYGEIFKRLFHNLPKAGSLEYNNGDRWVRSKYDEISKGLNDWVNLGAHEVKSIKIPLWDLWLYGRLSFADKNFPWRLTGQSNSSSTAGELEPGSFGFWFLTRSRCWGDKGGVVNDIKARPPLQELGDPDFFAGRLRNWTKVLGNVGADRSKPDYIKPEENPRAWWVLSLLYYHVAGSGKQENEMDFRVTTRSQGLTFISEGLEDRGVATGDIYRNALNCGFLRNEDIEWIKSKLKM